MPANNKASQSQPVNIWTQMSYVPPRGSCSQSVGIMTTCPCHRFMVHPVKAATSFECDGCGHHASFHKMDNQHDEAVVRSWQTAAGADAFSLEILRKAGREVLGVNPKRRRTADGSSATAALEIEDISRDHRRAIENPDNKRIRRE